MHYWIFNVLDNCCNRTKFSAFIDEKLNLYPCSFMIENYMGINLKEKTLLESWKTDENFKYLRKNNLSKNCEECEKLRSVTEDVQFLKKLIITVVD